MNQRSARTETSPRYWGWRVAFARCWKQSGRISVLEATAIFKAASTDAQIPTTGTFLSLEADGYALPSDWYLRLAGEVVNLFRGVYANQPAHPLVTTGGGVVCGDGVCTEEEEGCASCPDDCGACTGNCCVANDSPGCDDQAVTLCVCDADPTCCEGQWDPRSAPESHLLP